MSLLVQNLSYIHPNKDLLFQNLNFSVSPGEKCTIIGNNGIGKSTMLKIIAGLLSPSAGKVFCDDIPYMVPQHFGQFNDRTVAEALGVAAKMQALSIILEGKGSKEDFEILDDDWGIQERIADAFSRWNIDYITPDMTMENLSGDEKTKVFLAGLYIYRPSAVLMDDPTNNLDISSMDILANALKSFKGTLLVVSHDEQFVEDIEIERVVCI